MKTTIDIPDSLLVEIKQEAAARGTTVRALVEEGLRAVLSQGGKESRLRDASVGGEGLALEFQGRSWDVIRDVIYEGRGT